MFGAAFFLLGLVVLLLIGRAIYRFMSGAQVSGLSDAKRAPAGQDDVWMAHNTSAAIHFTGMSDDTATHHPDTSHHAHGDSSHSHSHCDSTSHSCDTGSSCGCDTGGGDPSSNN